MYMAQPTASRVFVNGVETAFEAFRIRDNNFFRLRDLAYALNGTEKQFEVGFDSVTGVITLTTGLPYTAIGTEMNPGQGVARRALPTPSEIYIDGGRLDFTVYNIEGSNFFRLRDLMSVLDVGVTFDAVTQNIGIDTSLPYTD